MSVVGRTLVSQLKEAHMAEIYMLAGFRIEFLKVGRLVAGAYCEDAYLVAALPRPGDLVSSGIIAGICPQRWIPVPFMTVAAVEHYPAKPPDQPAVHVVIRLDATDISVEDLRPLESLGWTVGWFPEK